LDATSEIEFFVVNPARGNQSVINLKTVFTQAVEESDLEGMTEMFSEWNVVNQHFVSDVAAAFKQIELKLKEYKEKNKQATLLVLQSSKQTEELQL